MQLSTGTYACLALHPGLTHAAGDVCSTQPDKHYAACAVVALPHTASKLTLYTVTATYDSRHKLDTDGKSSDGSSTDNTAATAAAPATGANNGFESICATVSLLEDVRVLLPLLLLLRWV
jgi:hypothetical protein